MRHKPWSATEIAKLNRLAAAGLNFLQIAAEFPERSLGGIRDFCRKNEIEVSLMHAPPERLAPIDPTRFPNYAGMSLTARLLGDPAPGRSALAQKQQGGA